ncbi:hypothetical protein MMU07_03490 [Aquiflexum sp. LQ15W]|uniref:hypothetical protein n=1 Tax=Cognataquiflexum nitidum TaxID=2922272 RepID=UPI001F12F569|nr:hypothetical protein [Cognataquiflexum nitidum]MCH6198629.1 hypothetical protein [Cognataquiflexum nitidum]
MTFFPFHLISSNAVIQSGTDRILIDTGAYKTIHSQGMLSVYDHGILQTPVYEFQNGFAGHLFSCVLKICSLS